MIGVSSSYRRFFYPAVAGVLALGLVAACSSSVPTKDQPSKPSKPSPASSAPVGSADGQAVNALPELSLAQMAGQRVIYSYTGLRAGQPAQLDPER